MGMPTALKRSPLALCQPSKLDDSVGHPGIEFNSPAAAEQVKLEAFRWAHRIQQCTVPMQAELYADKWPTQWDPH